MAEKKNEGSGIGALWGTYVSKPIDTYVADPIRKAMGIYVPPVGPPQLPHAREGMSEFRRRTKPKNFPSDLSLYRGNEKKGGLETLPSARFDSKSPLVKKREWWRTSRPQDDSIQQMYGFARVLGAARAAGLPTMDPRTFASLVLKEGRPDAGYNSFRPQARADVEYRKKLDLYNIPDAQKNFLGLINYTQRVSKAKKVPFEAVWNGLGTNEFGQTGQDYAKAMGVHRNATYDPKNAAFMGYVNSAYSAGEKYKFPLMIERAKDEDVYLKSDPTYKYHTPDGRVRPAKTFKDMFQGGGVVIDDGDPAKRRRLI